MPMSPSEVEAAIPAPFVDSTEWSHISVMSHHTKLLFLLQFYVQFFSV